MERGHALLADFGIAQAKAGTDETRLTGMGTSLGTPAYMSPEQISGEGAVDGRSDQYALACVLYEMLAGHPPFTGSDIQTVMRQHLAAEAPKVTGARAAAPTGLAKAIHRALAKTPADRYRTVAEFEKALAGATLPLLGRIPMGRARAVVYMAAAVLVLVAVAVVVLLWRPRGPDLAEDLVAVIPFGNETGNAEFEPVGKMVAHSVLDELHRVGVARVVPYDAVTWSWDEISERTAMEPDYDPVAAIVTEYGAGTVVSRSLFSQGDSLRLSAEIRGEGGAEMIVSIAPVRAAPHAEGIEQGISQVSQRVAAAVKRYLDPDWSDIPSRATPDPPPTLVVLRAMDLAYEAWAQSEMQECRRQVERALELAPDYLPAKTFLAHFVLGRGGFAVADSLLNELEGYLDQMSPAERFQWEWDRTSLEGDLEAHYRCSKEGYQLTPTPVGALVLGWAARDLNRPGKALEAIDGIDPESPSLVKLGQSMRIESDRCEYLHLLGEHHQELREARRLRSAYPDETRPLLAEIRARAALGQADEVDALVEEAIRKEANAVLAAETALRELLAHGHPDAAREVGERNLAYLQARPAEEQETASHKYDLLWAFYQLERWEEAQALAEELVRIHSSDPFYLSILGTLAAHRGQREEALGMAEQIAAMEPPYDRGRTTYFRACIASLLGERDEALRLLREAHEQGRVFGIRLHTDPDLEPVRDYASFQEFMRPKG